MDENKKTILMIESDGFLMGLYKDRLKSEGFEFITSDNGIEGMDKIISEKPDLIILDMILPFKNGFDILEEMNKSGLISKIPVIVLSNLKQDSDIEEARRLGAEDYFIKSEANLSEVIKKIKEIL